MFKKIYLYLNILHKKIKSKKRYYSFSGVDISRPHSSCRSVPLKTAARKKKIMCPSRYQFEITVMRVTNSFEQDVNFVLVIRSDRELRFERSRYR